MTSTSFYSLKTRTINDDVRKIIQRILKDIRVEMGDKFDRDFGRQAFFSETWQRRRSPTRPGGSILIDSGSLRRNIRSRTTKDSITFYIDLPYTAIHNDGGEVVVTKRMKDYSWHKYMILAGVLQWARYKDGTMRRDKQTRQQSTEAEFWKLMVLKKESSTTKIPRRRFLGTSPEVKQTVRETIKENITGYFNVDFDIRRK